MSSRSSWSPCRNMPASDKSEATLGSACARLSTHARWSLAASSSRSSATWATSESCAHSGVWRTSSSIQSVTLSYPPPARLTRERSCSATNRSAVETDARAQAAASFVSRRVCRVASSMRLAAAIATRIAPVLVPPRTSNPSRTRCPETSRAHCRRASASKPCASSTTQWRMGGRILPSTAMLRSSSEWLVTTTSLCAARRRAPWTRHSPG